jgi:hypothetical protein
VSKFRISSPENLIDTDFEYGLQSTKWETIELINNIPVFFARDGDTPIPLADVSTTENSDIVQVTTVTPAGLIVGAPFIIKGLASPSTEGSFVVFRTNPSNPNIFYYRARFVQTYTGSIYDSYSTTFFIGRIYQSTQYNSDNLVNIITQGNPPDASGNGSFVTVTTKFPHGFKVNSRFVLTNSTGIRQINFDASLINTANTLTLSNLIPYTNSNNNLYTGFRSRNVIPYDYESKKTLTFNQPDIDTVNNKIYIPNHGQTDSVSSSNLFLYQSPIGDETVNGLINGQIYGIKVIDTNNINLVNVAPTYIPGLWDINYQIGTYNSLAMTGFSSNLSTLNNIFDYPFFYSALQAMGTSTPPAGINIWTGASYNGVAPVRSLDGIAVGNSNYMQWNSDQTNTAHCFFGYYKPIYSGVSNIELRCLDFAKLWFGDDADWPTGSSKLPSMYISYLPTYTTTGIRTSLSLGTIGINTYTTPSLLAGNLYPVRIITATSNILGNVGKGSISTLAIRVKENLETFGAFPSATGIGNYNYTLCNLFVAPIIGRGNVGTGPNSGPFRPITINNTDNVPLVAPGGNVYGEHTLQKVYPIVGIASTSANVATIAMNLQNYQDANISLGSFVSFVAPSYSSNIPQFTRDIFASGRTPVASSPSAYFAEAFPRSFSNLFPAAYTKFTAAGRTQGSVTVGIGSYTNTTDISFTAPGTTSFKYTFQPSVAGVLPINSFLEYDAFYIPSHGYSEDNVVSINLLDGTKQLPTSSNVGGDLVIADGSSYKVNVVSSDFIRLKGYTSGVLINLTSIGNAPVRFIKTISNPNKDTIYAPSHNLAPGAGVVYSSSNQSIIQGLTQGTQYYVYNPTTNYFGLSTNQNNLAGTQVDFISTGTGTHFVQTTDRDTDGNYVVTSIPDINSMVLQSTNFIPPRVINFYPPSTINLSTSTFYLPNHQLMTGAVVGYSNYGTVTDITGLTKLQDYYTIRIDTKNIKLASSYTNAVNNVSLSISDYGYGSNHMLNVKTIMGEIPINNSISLSNIGPPFYAYSLSNFVPNLDFLQILKRGDNFLCEIPGTEEIDYYGTSNDTTTFAFTLYHQTSNAQLNASLNPTQFTLNTGEMIQYQRYGVGATEPWVFNIGLSNAANYYVRSDAGAVNKYFLYNSPSDAQSDINRVRVTGTNGLGARFVKRVPNIIFSTQINYINSSYQLTLSNNPYNLTSNANFLNRTYLFPKADGYAFHRAYDGGVELLPTTNPDARFIRQTRKYFRYQSGKGIQCSKSVNFNGSTDIQYIVRNVDSVTNKAKIETRFPHRLQVGAQLYISGAVDINDPNNLNWNSSNTNHYYYVSEVPSLTTAIIYYPLNTLPNSVSAGGLPRYNVRNWVSSTLSVGLFDDQNGIFFQYDGTTLYACRRNSTSQLPGYGQVTFNSCKITGNQNCRFVSILSTDSYIVIKGCTYKVTYVESNNVIYIQPPYRGKDSANAVISLVQDTKIPQSQWNIDPGDGTGPTGYKIDISKIQMVYIDYSWYGAGKVRYGFKDVHGICRYFHELLHNNYQDTAYIRSGNLPGRYEVANQGNPTYTPSLMHWGTSVIMDGRFDDDRAYLFTVTGKLLSYFGTPKYIGLGANADQYARSKSLQYNNTAGPYYNPNTGKLEYAYRLYSSSIGGGGTNQFGGNLGAGQVITSPPITFESIANLASIRTGTILNGFQLFGPSNTVFGDWSGFTLNKNGTINTGGTFSATQPATTVLNTVSYSTTLFYLNTTYSIGGKAEAATIGPNILYDVPTSFVPLISIRLGPSVDNGVSSLVGVREIINRMQLVLDSIGILTTHDVEIQLRLNGYPFTYGWINATPPSLCQYISHDKGDTVSGGTNIYSFRAQGGPLAAQSSTLYGRSTNSTTFTLGELATLGNSIIGGDSVFPDGPDVLTIGFVLLDNTYITPYTPFTCTARISWKESQA